MSFALMAWANEQTTGSGTRKAVLLALADRANADTGKCCPSVELIAEQTEFSVRTVQTALVDLCESGLIARDRRRRSDGSLAGYHYTFPSAAPASPAAAPAASPPAALAGQEEPGSKDLEPVDQERTQLVRSSRPKLGKVDRLPVKAEHEQLANEILDVWNAATGQRHNARDSLARIVMRIREHPELTLAEHEHLIHANLADPWWKGTPGLQVIYGNGIVFENSIAKVESGGAGGVTARRYGRGMTTEEILRMTREDAPR